MSKSQSSGAEARDFFETVRESSTQIWLAGLGAFAKAQEEGGKAFERLAREGEAHQQRMRAMAEAQLQGLQGWGDELGSRMSEAGNKAQQAWDRLEGVFEERVLRAAQRLGLPTQEEVARLREAVERLSEEVAALRAQPRPATSRAPAAKKAPVKAAARAVKKPSKTAAEKG